MAKSIVELRDTLFETLEGVRNGTIPPARAKQICDVAQIIINSANAETNFIKTINGRESTGFMLSQSTSVNTNKNKSTGLSFGVSKQTQETKSFFELKPTRNNKIAVSDDGKIIVGDLEIVGDSVSRNGKEIVVTNDEFTLLYLIAQNSPVVSTYKELSEIITVDGSIHSILDSLLIKMNYGFDNRIMYHRKGEGYFIKNPLARTSEEIETVFTKPPFE